MRKIYAFDFDGTLTTKDTLLEFIRFAKGSGQMFCGFLLFSPLLLLMKLHLYPNWKAKQLVFSYFFKGMNIDDFNALCTHFAEQNKHLLPSCRNRESKTGYRRRTSHCTYYQRKH